MTGFSFPWGQTPIHHLPFILLDLETTGFSPPSARITEVAIVSWLGGPDGNFQSLIDPEIPIPPEITRLTGITQSMVTGKPKIHDVIPAIKNMLESGIFVSHNVPFDYNFLNQAFLDCLGRPLAVPHLCTLHLSRKYLGLRVNKLESVAQHLGLKMEGAHRAGIDTEAVRGILSYMLDHLNQTGLKTGHDLVRAGLIKLSYPETRR